MHIYIYIYIYTVGEAHVEGGEVSSRDEEDAVGQRGDVWHGGECWLEESWLEPQRERAAGGQRRVGAQRVREAARHCVDEEAGLLRLERDLKEAGWRVGDIYIYIHIHTNTYICIRERM